MIKGSCYCGAVRYELHGKLLMFTNCHCPDCRKMTGSTFSSVLVAESGMLARERSDTLGTFGQIHGHSQHSATRNRTHRPRQAVASWFSVNSSSGGGPQR